MIRRSWTRAASIEETLALWAASLLGDQETDTSVIETRARCDGCRSIEGVLGDERRKAASVPFKWVAGDTVYGVGDIEQQLRRAGKGYVLGVSSAVIYWSIPAIIGVVLTIELSSEPVAVVWMWEFGPTQANSLFSRTSGG